MLIWNPTNSYARLTAAGFCGFLIDYTCFKCGINHIQMPGMTLTFPKITQELRYYNPSGQHTRVTKKLDEVGPGVATSGFRLNVINPSSSHTWSFLATLP